jgi:hypothetical protein
VWLIALRSSNETFYGEILKTNIIAVLKEFQTSGKFEKSLNATFVSLIPKKAGAVDIKDFRPISLIGGMYQIG